MTTIFVSGNDTDAGKTHVVAHFAGTLAERGLRAQIVKLVETGMPCDDSPGDADRALEIAREIAGTNEHLLSAFRLERYALPLAPTEAARREGKIFSIEKLKRKLGELPPCDVRLVEGAGGLGVPVDEFGNDWADFAREILRGETDFALLVVENRLGAISQARFLAMYCAAKGVPAPRFWLNEKCGQSREVLESNSREIPKLSVPVIGESFPGRRNFRISEDFSLRETSCPRERKNARENAEKFSPAADFSFYAQKLSAAHAKGCLREISGVPAHPDFVDLSANDYLNLARDPAVRAGAIRAIGEWGASSSASPLITGYKKIHERLETELCDWLGFRHGLIWNTGFAANACVFGTLPQKTDLILADRLIHRSMIEGILKSGATLRRFRHNDVAHLRELLEKARAENFAGTVFVATESVFSMDGDSPDLAVMAELRDEFKFVWIVDEAHATGWFGTNGGGKIDELGLSRKVDILVGTLGKSLGSAGAYTLFNDKILRDYLVNFGAEFIFSTYLPPSACGAALAAVRRVRNFSPRERSAMPAMSRAWRSRLREIVSEIPGGDSAVIPVPIGDENETMRVAAALRKCGFRVGAIRPPTVPAGTSRLRISLNRSLSENHLERFANALADALGKSAR